MTTAALSQSHFRGRSDTDIVNNTPTWAANEDTNWTQSVDTPFRVRFAIQETAGGNPSAHTVKLRYQRNGGTVTDVTAASFVVQSITSASTSADETAISTSRLTGTGTFVNGVYDETGATSTSVDLAANGRTEYEFGVIIDSGGANPGDTITLHVFALSGTSITVTQQPTITVRGLLQPALFTNSNTFYAPSISVNQTLTPSLYTDVDTFYAPAVSSIYTLTPGLYTDADTFYSPTIETGGLTPGEYTITIRAFDGVHYGVKTLTITVEAAAAAQGTPLGLLLALTRATGSGATLTPSLYTDPDTFYAPTITTGGEAGTPLGLLLAITKG